MNQRLRRTLITGSAMFGVWDRGHFPRVVDYESWEAELLDDADIERHIDVGHFVPITIYSDGAFEFEVRVGIVAEHCSLDQRERRYVIASSEPYLFRSAGELNVSASLFVDAAPEGPIGRLEILAGDYDVTVHQIEWRKEPGATDEQGKPSPEALADFVVLVNRSDGTVQSYRKQSGTFG